MVKVKADIVGDEVEKALDDAGRSTQLPEDAWDYDKTGAKEPPYNLEALAYFLEINTWHFRCCKTKAVTTAGLGFDFVVPEGVDEPNEEHKKTLQKFFAHPNEEQTWGEVLENVLTDYEALGNGYFEVVRNRLGQGAPTAIYHVPAVTMRVRKDKKGYVQQRSGKMVYFRNFGSDPKDTSSFDPREKDKPLGDKRFLNEIIHLKNYHPRSSYYGLPDFLPAFRALIGDKKSGEFNIQFFENNAVPQYAIIVKGGELARGTRQRIEEYFRMHIKGNAHKTLILEVIQDGEDKVDVEIKPLSVDIKDASFRMFRSDNAEEIRVAHGVPGRLIGLTEKGGLGGAGEGTTQQEIFKYHVIEPKQSRLEYRINNFLIKKGFGIEDWEIRFKEIDVTDEGKTAEIVERLVRLGVLTINEGRRQMSQKPLKHPGADVPFVMAATGPLSLDVLAEGGGVRPLNMPPKPEEPTVPAKTASKRAPFTKAQKRDRDIDTFKARYLVALDKALRNKFDEFEEQGLEGEIDEVLAYAEKLFGSGVADDLRPSAEKYLKSAFRSGQSLKLVPSQIATLWDKPRQAAVDWLVEHDRFWIGKVFPQYLRSDFRDVIAQGLEEGLGRRDIGRRLRETVFGKPGVPAKEEYYTRIAATSVSRANNWGGVFSLGDAGIEAYTWRAVGDERTCARCMYLDGQVFSTGPAIELVQKALDGSPEDIEGLSPWPAEDAERNDFYIETKQGREYIRGKNADWLQEQGIGLPPLHARCRCTTVAGS